MDALVGMGLLGSLALSVFLLILLVLLILVPFFIYGTNNRTKQTAMLLKETNKLLAEIRDRLPAPTR